MIRHPDRTRLASEEAAYWYIRCTDERPMMLSDRRVFLSWLKRSPENISELLRICNMDDKLARKKLIATVTAIKSNVIDIGLTSDASDYFYDPTDSLDEEQGNRMNGNKGAFTRRWAAIAATVTLAFALTFAAKNHLADGSIETGPSQWQKVTLADGSLVHVDARTSLKVEFSAEGRIVHLYAGSAVFEVEKDADRPFTVSTDLVDVTAVGTRFSVAIDPGVTTTVTEGVVEVTSHGNRDHRGAVMVRAGEQLHVSDSGLAEQSSAKIEKVDAERKLEWVNGWFVFSGETIGQAATEFNRRNAIQIRIADPLIANRQLSYYRLRVESPQTFAKMVDAQPGIAVKMNGSTIVLQSE